MEQQLMRSSSIKLVKNKELRKRIIKYKYFYLMFVPAIIFFIVFHYIPMGGIIIAFKDYKFSQGFLGSGWVGLKWFNMLFNGSDFWHALRNTLIISIYKITFTFPAPIILAFLLNEIKNNIFKRSLQTIVYFPHFISWVVIGGIIFTFLSQSADVLKLIGIESSPLMNPKYFRGLLVISQMWKETGWGTVVYMAAISSINVELYESAIIDGANRFKQAIYITLPSIKSTIVILLILRMGGVLSAGFEQIFILANPTVNEVADVLDTYVYRLGVSMGRFSLATAAGLFKSVVGLMLISLTNWISRKVGEEGVW